MELDVKGMIRDLRQIKGNLREQSNRIDSVMDCLCYYVGEEKYVNILREVAEEDTIKETLERR